jgi:hypothetical protein
MEQLPLAYNDHTLFHMLRHFETIHEPAFTCLLERGYSPQAIKTALQIPGSRFLSSFAQDLKLMEQQMLFGKKQIEVMENGYHHWYFQFDPKQFPDGIGKIGVVPIKNLAVLGAVNLVQKFNRGLFLKHATVDKLPVCWEMTVVVKPQKNYYLLITAFPGSASMPLPKPKLDTVFNNQCLDYWTSHAFLELPSTDCSD